MASIDFNELNNSVFFKIKNESYFNLEWASEFFDEIERLAQNKKVKIIINGIKAKHTSAEVRR
jgi:hypothetical protein